MGKLNELQNEIQEPTTHAVVDPTEKLCTEQSPPPIRRNKEEPKNLDGTPDKKIRVNLCISTSTYEKIKQEAGKREVTRGSILREALREYFAGLENVEKRNPDRTGEIEKIKELIDKSTDWFGNFNLEQFLGNAQKQELVGDEIWTQELLEAYLIPKIRQASEGFLSPSQDENCNKCIRALQLGEENVRFLAENLGLDITQEHEIEEPFGLI